MRYLTCLRVERDENTEEGNHLAPDPKGTDKFEGKFVGKQCQQLFANKSKGKYLPFRMFGFVSLWNYSEMHLQLSKPLKLWVIQ